MAKQLLRGRCRNIVESVAVGGELERSVVSVQEEIRGN